MAMRIADRNSIKLRFPVGTRVECKTGPWVTGTVVAQFYVQKNFQEGTCMPYQVRLDDGSRIYAPVDDDKVIRRLSEESSEFEMHEAVNRRDVATVNRLLKKETDLYCLSELDETGQCVMHIATMTLQ